MAERVQADTGAAGQLRPVTHGHLLRHRARREERGSLRAEQLGDPQLQLRHRPALAVQVGRVVPGHLIERGELFPYGGRAYAGEHRVAATLGDEPAQPRGLLVAHRSARSRRSRATASASTSGRLQNANRISRRPASTSS